MIFKKIRILHIGIAAIIVIEDILCYHAVRFIRSSILITKPILADYNESDRKIFEEELGIKFVRNTVITETQYVAGQDPSFCFVFNFPQDEIDEFYIGIEEHYHEVSGLDPNKQGRITLNGVFLKGYDHNNYSFTTLYLYKSEDNRISVYLIYSEAGESIRKVLMNKVG